MPYAAMTGPVNFALISFPGSTFSGDVAPALAELAGSRAVRIIDLAFVTKDPSGAVRTIELSSLPPDAAEQFGQIASEASGLLTPQDVAEMGADLVPGSSGLMVVWEAVWAARLAHAVAESGGRLVISGRVPQELLDAAAIAHRR